ncbi:OadG family protein [Enterococcus devriesei]|uniref:OadG family protein n=1 Tax=Enterococcus devriesei TaxID=319970 RepID=UPI0028ABD7C2|nr:OadG family protein [Enterococcus devriesei]
MHYSLIEVLRLTVFSMAVVFLILLGIMGLMMLSAKLFAEKPAEEAQMSFSEEATDLSTKELFTQDPLAKAAAIIALAEASGEKDGKKFKIQTIRKIK